MNNAMPKVSVVTLIYNVEDYIERCVRSLMEQTLDDIEFIFVNDCSTDDSLSMLEKVLCNYPNRKNQVKIHTNDENRGSASSRNIGLQLATGEYIISCDGDDWVDTDAYECMYDAAKKNNADIVLTDFYQNYPNRERHIKQMECHSNVAYVNGLLTGSLHGSTWNKLVRRSLYVRFDISYKPGINLWEDLLINVRLFLISKEITYIPKAFYHYWRGNVNSYTKTKNMQILREQMNVVNILTHILEPYKDAFECSLCLLKLRVKVSLLIYSSSINERKAINNLYPEAQSYIRYCRNVSVLWRILLRLSYHNEVYLSTLIIAVGRYLKSYKNR